MNIGEEIQEDYEEMLRWKDTNTYEEWVTEEQGLYNDMMQEIQEAVNTLRHHNRTDLLSDKGVFYGIH